MTPRFLGISARALSALLLLAGNGGSDAATAFGARESVEDISLSPDGTRLAYVAPGPGQSGAVYTVSLETGESVRAAASDGDPQRLSSCRWSANTRLVCRVYAVVKANDEIYPVNRLVAVDADGGNIQILGDSESDYARGVALSGGSIIDWLPGEDGQVLMEKVYVPEQRKNTRMERKQEGLGVERVDTRTMKTSPVERPARGIAEFMTDGRGKVRIRSDYDVAGGTQMLTGDYRYFYRPTGSNGWQPLSIYNANTREGSYPLAIESGTDTVLMAKKVDGRMAIHRLALDGSMTETLVFSHPNVDVDDIIRIGKSRRPVGVSYATDKRQAMYFDPELAALSEKLHNALPKLPMIRFVDASDDESKLLLWAGSDSDPGRYYVYTKATQSLAEIMLSRPQLEGVKLANVKPISFKATDGTQIPGYLTLPPGSTGKNLPTIVMPHGGPQSRDEWNFDWLAQFFANRGYAVIQPNFRGSAGYGDLWFEENGFRSWQTAIGDVVDAGRWTIEQGVSDPRKLAIFGWSYGGYAALQANVVAPDMFKAAIAVAPVTDLALLREESRGWTDYRLTREFIGNGPHIAAGSPAQHASEFKAPVLIFHGELDRNVAVGELRLMKDRLKDAGKRVEYVEFEKLDHYLDDSSARAVMLSKSDAFLREAMGIAN